MTAGAAEGRGGEVGTGTMPREVADAIDYRVLALIEEALRFNDGLKTIARNCYLQGYRDAKQETGK